MRIASAIVSILSFFLMATSVIADDQTICNDQNSPIDIAIAACSRLISSSKNQDSALAKSYNRRGLLYSTVRDYDRASADLSEGIRLASLSTSSLIQSFITTNSALIIWLGTLIAAASGWYLTYHGWTITHRNNSILEQEKYRNVVDLEKRKAELALINDQIRYLYGPLMALCATRRAAFDALMKKAAPNRSGYFDDGVRTPEELRTWRLWRTEVLMPLIVQMEQAILQHSHLIEGAEMPSSTIRLLSHVAAYKAVIKNWVDVTEMDKANGTHEIDNLKTTDYTSVINFPENFAADVERSFRRLRAKQAELIARVQVLQT